MVLSALIDELQIRLKIYGDLPVYISDISPAISGSSLYADDETEVSGTRHLEGEDRKSTCCGEEEIDDSDICGACKEHADFEGLPERIYLKS